MKNVEMKVEGIILNITVDLGKEYGLSGSGKFFIIASTEGNQALAAHLQEASSNVIRALSQRIQNCTLPQ